MLLRTARGDRTQEEIAKSIGVTQAAVSNWENGTVPNPPLWRKIARVYKIPLDKLSAHFVKAA